MRNNRSKPGSNVRSHGKAMPDETNERKATVMLNHEEMRLLWVAVAAGALAIVIPLLAYGAL